MVLLSIRASPAPAEITIADDAWDLFLDAGAAPGSTSPQVAVTVDGLKSLHMPRPSVDKFITYMLVVTQLPANGARTRFPIQVLGRQVMDWSNGLAIRNLSIDPESNPQSQKSFIAVLMNDGGAGGPSLARDDRDPAIDADPPGTIGRSGTRVEDPTADTGLFPPDTLTTVNATLELRLGYNFLRIDPTDPRDLPRYDPDTGWQAFSIIIGPGEPDLYGEMVAPPLLLKRDIPDTLTNGGSGTVTILVSPQSGGEGVVVIDEDLPPTLVPSNPSRGGTIAGHSIHWDLGNVTSDILLSYTMTVDPAAADITIPGKATLDGLPFPITGDTAYTGSPVTTLGFIKLWNHLGPLAWAYPARVNDHGDNGVAGACSALDPLGNSELDLDWIANADGSITETNIHPFPGMLIRPGYGGDGAGNGARAAGLTVQAGDSGTVTRERYPAWKGTLSRSDSIVHESAFVNGFDAEDHVTMSCVYVTNETTAPLQTQIGLGSDDSIQVWLNDSPLPTITFCRGFGAPNEEQDLIPATLPVGESRILVKVSDGCCQSGFRLRFQDVKDPNGGGLVPPVISLSLESKKFPPPARAVRQLSKTSFGLGETVDVSLALSAPAPTDLTVTEALPAGSLARDISPGGTQVGDTIEWHLSQVTQRSVSYKLVPQACSGDLSFEQSTVKVGPIEALVGGQSSLSRELQDEPLGVWASEDILATGGSAQKMGSHEVFVNGTGGGVKSQRDELRFISIPRNGDFEISARIDCLQGTSSSGGQAGLMVRDSALPNAATLFLAVSTAPPTAPAVGVASLKARVRRDLEKFASDVSLTDAAVTSYPVYIKMVRTSTPAPQVQFFRSSDGASWGTPIGSRNIGMGTADINLKADTLVGLGVTGNNGVTRAGYSQVSGPPFTVALPDPPVGLSAAGGVKQVTLSWSPPAAGPAPTGYSIHGGGEGGPYARIADVPASPTSYTDSGLVDSTRYCYVVKSKGAGGESSPSAEACARTITGVPFKRGDADGDGAVNLTDPIFTLTHQFQGGIAPPCMDAADVDDQGDYNLTDAIYSLQWQFLAGQEPPKPGPFQCGPEDTADVFPEADCKYPAASCQ